MKESVPPQKRRRRGDSSPMANPRSHTCCEDALTNSSITQNKFEKKKTGVVTLASKRASSRMLAGLMSRCTTRFSCRYASALKAPSAMRSRAGQGSTRLPAAKESRAEPRASSLRRAARATRVSREPSRATWTSTHIHYLLLKSTIYRKCHKRIKDSNFDAHLRYHCNAWS